MKKEGKYVVNIISIYWRRSPESVLGGCFIGRTQQANGNLLALINNKFPKKSLNEDNPLKLMSVSLCFKSKWHTATTETETNQAGKNSSGNNSGT
jgi:hypothetical protein